MIALLLLGCEIVCLSSCKNYKLIHSSSEQTQTKSPNHTEWETSLQASVPTNSTQPQQTPLNETDMKNKILSNYHMSFENLSKCYLYEPNETEAEQLLIINKRVDVSFPAPLKIVHFENQRSFLFAQLQYDEVGFHALQSLFVSDGYPNYETPNSMDLVNEQNAPDWWYAEDTFQYAKSWTTLTKFIEI